MIRPRVYDLPLLEKERYDALVTEFERAWREKPDDPPRIEDHLPSDEPVRTLVLVALIKADLESRVIKKQPVRIENYFDRFPEFTVDLEAKVELVAWEREIASPEQTLEEYVCRFPQLEQMLRARIPASSIAPTWTDLPGYSDFHEVGRGSMGVVYRAWDDTLSRMVAIKYVFPALCSDENSGVRFRHEAEIVACLDHPYVVEIYKFGEHEQRLYCVFEFCPGGNLAQRLAPGPMSSNDAAKLIVDVASGVKAAHEKGVIHRDLKPANILFSARGNPKVADFGLALRLTDDRMTLTGERIGTISYSAPEQFSDPADVDERSDVYAIGAIMYHCLTGRPPFNAATVAQTYYQLIHEDPVTPHQFNPVARDIETICLKCLAKRPGDRYESVAALQDELDRFLNDRPILATRPGPIVKLHAWRRRNPLLSASLLVSSLALAGVIIMAVFYAVGEHQNAARLKRAYDQAQLAVALSNWDRGHELSDDGKIGQGLLTLIDALENVPDGPEHDTLRESIRISLSAWSARCHSIERMIRHPRAVRALILTPDGRTAFTGCDDGAVRAWDLPTGRLIHVWRGHESPVKSIALIADQNQFFSADDNGMIFRWAIDSSQPIGTFLGHTKTVSRLDVSRDNGFLVSGSTDKTVRIWNLETESLVARVDFPGEVSTVGFDSDAQAFYAGGSVDPEQTGRFCWYDFVQHVENGTSLPPAWSLEFDLPVSSASLSPDSTTLMIGDENWEATLWNLPQHQRIATTDEGEGTITATAFTHDGNRVAFGTRESRRVRFRDVADLQDRFASHPLIGLELTSEDSSLSASPSLPHPAPITDLVFDPNGSNRLLTACEDGIVRVWNDPAGYDITVLEHHPRIASKPYPNRSFVVWSVDSNEAADRIATAGWDGRVLLWSLSRRDRVGKALVHDSPLMAVAFTPSGRSLITGCKDGWLRVWDVRGHRLVDRVKHHCDSLSGFSLNPDGIILTGGEGTFHRWRIVADENSEKLEPVGEILRHSSKNINLETAVSRDSQTYLSCGEDGIAKLWERSGTLIASLGHENQVRDGDFHFDGKTVVTASDDRTARIWNASNGQLQRTLSHNQSVLGAAFVGDTNCVITSSQDGAQLWDGLYGRRIGPPCIYEDAIVHIDAKSGSRAILADWRGYGLVWTLPQPVTGSIDQIKTRIESLVGITSDGSGGFKVRSSSD